jgi:hypothetical protein
LFINEKSITKWQPINKTKGIVCFFIFFSLSIMSLISFITPSSGSEFDEDLSKNRIIIPDNFNFTGAIRTLYKSEEDYLKVVKFGSDDDVNAYGLALANLMLGLVKKDPVFILNARSLFRISNKISDKIREKELSLHGIHYTDNLLSNGFKDILVDNITFEPITIEKQKPQVKKFNKIIIGKSSIKIKKGSKIKTQVDRVTRDWLSAYRIDSPPWQFSKNKLVPYHEGKKIKEILDAVDAEVSIVWGTRAKKIANKWYAPDAEGIYRFRIAEDKIYNYPTNIILDEQTLFINDTHGINTIAWDSLDTDLVVGCGDLDGKIEAAYYLANKGVNVYMPTDRFIGTLIGVKTKGTIIGSAPVKKTSDGAVIGDQPISIDINEPIMVTNAEDGYPIQYYDAPYRYFKELEKYIGRSLKIMTVEIDEYGKADKIIERAQKENVRVIGTRVASKEEYEAVSGWLRVDKSHRAILFHSAVYPEGYKLFFEFPTQTTFGDINIFFE